MRKTYVIIAALCTTLVACTDRGAGDQTGAQLEMVLQSGATTRAHFEDHGGSASFVWDVGGEMIAVASHGGAITSWVGGDYLSPMNVTLLDPSDSHKVIGASSSLCLAREAAEAGDPLFFLSPVVGSALCTVGSSASAVSVDFMMPSTFAQSASTRLDEFGPYCFIHGESTILAAPTGSNKNFTAQSTAFRAIPATFRFNVSNDTSADIVLKSVKITCNKLFPDRLVWSANGANISIREPADKSGYFNTIKTLIASGLGETIAAKDGLTVSKGTYYAMCLPFDSNDSMTGATLAFILETADKVHTFNLSAAEFFGGAGRFESNKIYTFNFSLGEESVELEGVTISDWVGEPFHTPTEEVSAYVKVSPTYWVQDRENLYTYAFSKLLDNTLWGECNIGEYLYYATDYTWSWNEVSPRDASDQDYLSRYYDNITDFKWATPLKADYEAILDETATKVEMTRDGDSGIFGLKISRKDNDKVSIFLPCTEKDETETKYSENEEEVTHITRRLQGYYWTLDEDSGDKANALLLHFMFRQDEKLKGETITSITYKKGLTDGGNLYEFVSRPKTESHTVRPILRQ